MTSYLEMATVQEKAMCVCHFFETKSVNKMQRRYRTQYGEDPPSDKTIRRWLKQLQETGSVLHRKGTGRPSTSQENVDRIQEVWTSYVPRKALMLKLFTILQH
jgi:transposase